MRRSQRAQAVVVPALADVEVPLPSITPVGRAGRANGLTPEVLIVSTILALPGLWTSLVLDELPLHLMFERYLIVLFGVFLISEPLYWFGVGGRLAAPREFSPEEGHRIPRRDVPEPTYIRQSGVRDDGPPDPRARRDAGQGIFDEDELNAPAYDPIFDEADLNAPGEIGQPFAAAAPADDVIGGIAFDDPADLARPNFD